MVSDKKIFKHFLLAATWHQKPTWIPNLWMFFSQYHPRINTVKFGKNLLNGLG